MRPERRERRRGRRSSSGRRRRSGADGSVGVWGISYGGLTALAAGVARPPHLRAIAPMYPLLGRPTRTSLRPAESRTCSGMHQWSTIMLAQQLAPPTYRDADRALARASGTSGSNGSSGRASTLALADARRSGRLLARARAPGRADRGADAFLIGGWRDLFPEAVADGVPSGSTRRSSCLFGPVAPRPARHRRTRAGRLAVRFCSASGTRTLRGAGTAAGSRPCRCSSRVPEAGAAKPRGRRARSSSARCGRPPAAYSPRRSPTATDDIRGNAARRRHGGQWDAMATGMGYPLDQGPDDLLSLTYTTAPLDAPLELAGSPEVALDVERLAADGPVRSGREARRRGTRRACGAYHERLGRGRRGRGPPLGDGVGARARTPAPAQRLLRGFSAHMAGPDDAAPATPTRRLRGCGCRWYAARSAMRTSRRAQHRSRLRSGSHGRSAVARSGAWVIERDVANDTLAVTVGGGETMRLPEGGHIRRCASARRHASRRRTLRAPRSRRTRRSSVSDPDGEHVAVEVAQPRDAGQESLLGQSGRSMGVRCSSARGGTSDAL